MPNMTDRSLPSSSPSLTRLRLPPRRFTAGVAVSVTLLLGACGGMNAPDSGSAPGVGGSSSAVAPAPGNPSAPSGPSAAHDADVMFAQMMVPHHEQAVQMSDLLLAKPGLTRQVKTLAEQIRAAQAPEIATITGWLQQWGAPTAGGMAGMNHGDDGMLSAAELRKLGDADARQAQKLYVQGMIGHHRGAVAMAQTEIDRGSDPDAIALARDIVRTQNVEIETMTKLLPTL